MNDYEKNKRPIIIKIPQARQFKQILVCDTNNRAKRIYSQKWIRKPSEVSLRKFSILGDKPPQANDLKKVALLLPYRLYAKKQTIINNRRRRVGIKLEEKYKILNIDMRQRLFVDNPSDNVLAIRDIDESYFRNLNNHTQTTIVPLYKSLKFQYHEHLRTSQEVGYRRDSVLKIELNHKKILQKYEASIQNCIEQNKLYEKFMSQDYIKSIACLDKSTDLVAKVDKKQFELEHLANQQFLIQSRLIGLNFLYFKLQKYGRFLYYVSPPSWRAQHRDFARSVDIEAKGFDLGNLDEEETFNIIFKHMQNECSTGFIKPVLYYSRPEALMYFFDGMVQNETYQFTRTQLNDSHMKFLTQNLLKFKTVVKYDSAFIATIIEDFGEIINFLINREEYLKARFFKLLNGTFYDSVASTDVLKLQYYLDFCFEKVFLEKPSMNILTTASDLETIYMKYSFKLESINSGYMKEAIKENIGVGKKKMKTALNAAKELRQFDRLERSLMRTFKNTTKEGLFETIYRPSIRKVKRQIRESEVRAIKEPQITEAEFEYLTLFTDWTVKDNPAHYLHRLSV